MCGHRYLTDCHANEILLPCHACLKYLSLVKKCSNEGLREGGKKNALTIHNVLFDELYANLIFALQVMTRCQ